MKIKRIDHHIHSNISDGQGSCREIIIRAKKLGLASIAITDHYDPYDPSPHVSAVKSDAIIESLREIKDFASELDIEVLCGIETCTDSNGNLRIEDEIFYNCDLIITSPHYTDYAEDYADDYAELGLNFDLNINPDLHNYGYMDERYWEAYKAKVLAIAAGSGHILGHAEGYLPYTKAMRLDTTFNARRRMDEEVAEKYFGQNYLAELAKNLKKSGKAMELHCITCTPRENVIDYMSSMGIKFSIGSDAHTLDGIGKTDWGNKMIEKYKLHTFKL